VAEGEAEDKSWPDLFDGICPHAEQASTTKTTARRTNFFTLSS